MKRALIASVLVAGALLVAFILTPQAKVDHGIGALGEIDWRRGGPVDTRPEKSGIRIAIEGRLHWLGII